MSTDIVNLDLLNGGSFKLWQKKPSLNPVNVSSSEMTISFDVATSSMLCRIHSWTYIKTIPLLGNFGKLSRPDIAYAKTMDYGLEYNGDPSVLEGYTDASWITDQEDYRQPMPPISVQCDSQSTLSRAYNQVDNGKSRHIGLRHRQVNQLINDGVITVPKMALYRHEVVVGVVAKMNEKEFGFSVLVFMSIGDEYIKTKKISAVLKSYYADETLDLLVELTCDEVLILGNRGNLARTTDHAMLINLIN
ncbi:hypothetical protein Tco_0033627 [Tanacetum coccineum]